MPKVKFKENHALRTRGTVEWISSVDSAEKWKKQGKVEILDKAENPPKGVKYGIVSTPQDPKPAPKPKAAKPSKTADVKTPGVSKGMTTKTGPTGSPRIGGKGGGRR